MTKGKYTFDNAWHSARARLALLESVRDPVTIHNLESIGVSEGDRCLSAGAGSGSIAEWLCKRVGPKGQVVATDVDTRFLEAIDQDNLDVQVHNLVTDPLPADSFDFIQVRAVLCHIPERNAVLEKLVAALRPGGWILVEEPDFDVRVPEPLADPVKAEFFQTMYERMNILSDKHGIARQYGNEVPARLRALGLKLIRVEGHVAYAYGGDPEAEFNYLSLTQMRDIILEVTDITGDEYDQLLDLYKDPDFGWRSTLTVSTAARKETTAA